MATKRDAAAARKAAVGKLQQTLASRGCCTLGELFHDAGLPLDRPTVRALSGTAAVFARNVAAIGKIELESVHVSPRGAADAALGSDEVLVGILRRLAITGKARAHPVADLAKRVGSRDQAAFGAALRERVKQRRWPAGVGAVAAARSVLVFLLEDVMGAPARAERPVVGFATAFDEAFDRLRRDRGLNLVELSALRAALGGFPREDFDRELYELRRANRFVLHTFDGRHGKLRPEEDAAAIDEGGRRFVYAARRDP